jgi:hypothetical protein
LDTESFQTLRKEEGKGEKEVERKEEERRRREKRGRRKRKTVRDLERGHGP